MSNFQIQNLQFENHNIDFIEIDGKKYISSANMANALEYSSSKSITNLFNARKTEFVEGEDYTVIDMMTVKNAPYKQIFFSMEGVIGITMLAQTPKAVAFRQWARKTLTNLQQVPQLTGQEALYQLAEGLLKEKALRLEAEKDKLALENTVKEKEQVIQEKDERLETARQVFKKVADKSGCHSFRDCATSLGIPQKQLRELLEKNKWICPKAKDSKGNKILKPTVSGSQYDYVKYPPKEGLKLANGKVAKEFLITEKGYNKLMQQLGKL